ncbi:MAG: 1-acyl-sn-glycerol-3-phosphate acyltransferase [Bacteroidetes bacterium]|nr:MAG: 1-acyl-sn-glycerol-3-phosphate acyltransferase [Bacteroidota bacterium]
MRWLVQLLGNAYFYITTVLIYFCFTVMSPFVWILTVPFDPGRRFFHYFLSGWSSFFFRINPIWRMEVEGKEHLPEGAFVMVSNHQSLMDIIVLFMLSHHFKWVAKRELFRMPIIGWMLSMGGHIGIDRASRADAVRMINDCLKWLGKGVPVMIFPEGTRGKIATVDRFKGGAFSIAEKGGVPVVPVTIAGSAEMLPKFRYPTRRVHVKVVIHEAIAVEEVERLGAQEVCKRCEELIRDTHKGMRPGLYE